MSETPTVQPHVVVLSLNYRPGSHVLSYIEDLVNAGVRVDWMVAEDKSLRELEVPPEINVRQVFDSEIKGLILRKVERKLLFGLPDKVFGKTRKITRKGERLQLLDRTALAVRRRQVRVSKGVHRKIFWPVFRKARPMLIMRKARATALTFDLGSADRIIAADMAALPLAWRLAKRFPGVDATTALDRKPWIT